jgi:hypothetical protein
MRWGQGQHPADVDLKKNPDGLEGLPGLPITEYASDQRF